MWTGVGTGQLGSIAPQLFLKLCAKTSGVLGLSPGPLSSVRGVAGAVSPTAEEGGWGPSQLS